MAHGRAPGTIHYEDNDIAVFDNVLDWAPVMILFAPKEHISQNPVSYTHLTLPTTPYV